MSGGMPDPKKEYEDVILRKCRLDRLFVGKRLEMFGRCPSDERDGRTLPLSAVGERLTRHYQTQAPQPGVVADFGARQGN